MYWELSTLDPSLRDELRRIGRERRLVTEEPHMLLLDRAVETIQLYFGLFLFAVASAATIGCILLFINDRHKPIGGFPIALLFLGVIVAVTLLCGANVLHVKRCLKLDITAFTLLTPQLILRVSHGDHTAGVPDLLELYRLRDANDLEIFDRCKDDHKTFAYRTYRFVFPDGTATFSRSEPDEVRQMDEIIACAKAGAAKSEQIESAIARLIPQQGGIAQPTETATKKTRWMSITVGAVLFLVTALVLWLRFADQP